MTQSGQGEEPSAQPAREGIVLPSDGGEPLLPGMTTSAPRRAPRPEQPPAPPSDDHFGQYGAQHDRQHGQQHNQEHGRQQYGGQQQYGQSEYGQQQYGRPEYGQQQTPAGGQTWGQPWGPDPQSPAPQQPSPGWPLPADQTGQSDQRGQAHQQHQQHQQLDHWNAPQADQWSGGTQPGAGPLPPEGSPAPAHPTYGQGTPSTPLPPAAPPAASAASASTAAFDDGATQYIPPIPAAPTPASTVDEGATQYLPPVPAAAPVDEGATQYLPPVVPGALPPETQAESTHFLGRTPQNGPAPGPGPMPTHGTQPGAQPGTHSDAEATQYLPPVPAQAGGDRQPPAEFENLFRSGPGSESPAGSTQQLPRFSEPEPPGYGGHGGYGGPQGYGAGPAARSPQPAYTPPGDPAAGGRRGARDDDGGRGGRSGSRVPLFAAIGVALAVVGVGAGALLSGGGGGKGDDNKTVAASAPATGGSTSKATGAAEQQAVALDKLLADSGSSRASVISAVAEVKACGNLAQAATDLRAAAKQRTDLVTSLAGLKVDQLPNHDALTTALTKAWQASASADDHYAAWADQVAGSKKKSCKKGSARTTSETQAGNRDSGTASAQKSQAATLWNEIAKTYGLTRRQPTQL
ncbi:hypothetical protein [Streptomyces sp. ME18-1-4]|uniref:hypothetical protein n=1 Tax=Streptomyces sp. ME18-1-4 TaxID=3028685 RepID=UPI0029A08010|nr:hypothetical protein [Streptomyces sp. ME18-1-4]MDX3246219.1 hypothetical protein [Streptomyces sp. ME18-1-4]